MHLSHLLPAGKSKQDVLPSSSLSRFIDSSTFLSVLQCTFHFAAGEKWFWVQDLARLGKACSLWFQPQSLGWTQVVWKVTGTLPFWRGFLKHRNIYSIYYIVFIDPGWKHLFTVLLAWNKLWYYLWSQGRIRSRTFIRERHEKTCPFSGWLRRVLGGL